MIPNDKLLHFCIGYIIANIFTAIFGPMVGIIIATAAGAGKEYYDSKHKGNVESMDALATVLGGVFGSAVGYIGIILHG